MLYHNDEQQEPERERGRADLAKLAQSEEGQKGERDLVRGVGRQDNVPVNSSLTR